MTVNDNSWLWMKAALSTRGINGDMRSYVYTKRNIVTALSWITIIIVMTTVMFSVVVVSMLIALVMMSFGRVIMMLIMVMTHMAGPV